MKYPCPIFTSRTSASFPHLSAAFPHLSASFPHLSLFPAPQPLPRTSQPLSHTSQPLSRTSQPHSNCSDHVYLSLILNQLLFHLKHNLSDVLFRKLIYSYAIPKQLSREATQGVKDDLRYSAALSYFTLLFLEYLELILTYTSTTCSPYFVTV